MDTLVINILGGPGAGKTTIASELFARLKKLGIECENVSEFAKELVWQERNNAFNDRLYMHAMQNHRLYLLNGKVEIIILDSPLLLTSIYSHFYLEDYYSASYHSMLDTMVLETMKLYHNFYYYIKRKTSYQNNGRRENEKSALEIDQNIVSYLQNHQIEYTTVVLENAVDEIMDDLKNKGVI